MKILQIVLNTSKLWSQFFESYGFDWDKLISEEYTDQNSLLNRVGDTISFNITPKRRIDALNKIDELKGKDELIKKAL